MRSHVMRCSLSQRLNECRPNVSRLRFPLQSRPGTLRLGGRSSRGEPSLPVNTMPCNSGTLLVCVGVGVGIASDGSGGGKLVGVEGTSSEFRPEGYSGEYESNDDQRG